MLVSKFKYLGAKLNDKWDSDEEVKIRIAVARTTFTKFSQEVHWNLRLRVVKCYIWPIRDVDSEAIENIMDRSYI